MMSFQTEGLNVHEIWFTTALLASRWLQRTLFQLKLKWIKFYIIFWTIDGRTKIWKKPHLGSKLGISAHQFTGLAEFFPLIIYLNFFLHMSKG